MNLFTSIQKHSVAKPGRIDWAWCAERLKAHAIIMSNRNYESISANLIFDWEVISLIYANNEKGGNVCRSIPGRIQLADEGRALAVKVRGLISNHQATPADILLSNTIVRSL